MSKSKAAATSGQIYLPEVSGACQIRGDQLLVVSDELGLFIAREAEKQLCSSNVLPEKSPVELTSDHAFCFKDCEDIS